MYTTQLFCFTTDHLCKFTVFFFIFPPGNLKGLAFVQDPDGYWVEILNADNMARLQKFLSKT